MSVYTLRCCGGVCGVMHESSSRHAIVVVMIRNMTMMIMALTDNRQPFSSSSCPALLRSSDASDRRFS
jgi:hypothetical protein